MFTHVTFFRQPFRLRIGRRRSCHRESSGAGKSMPFHSAALLETWNAKTGAISLNAE
jgi:hypothetical protein